MSYQEIKESFEKLKAYCEQEEFRGWDPFDGLNSRLFNALPGIRNNRFSRLAWIQFFKRSPFNFRRIAGVKKEYNTKGLGLFLTGYCNLYQQQPLEEYKQQIYFLGNKLIELKTPGFSGSCWGYNFDWQARAFFQPKHTPTVVATSFVADALWNAYDCTGEQKFLDTALSSTAFIQKDLYRTYDEKGDFSFSYSPLDKTQVFNASLLGAKLLSRAYGYRADESFRNDAKKAVAYVCDRQQSNGAWTYGTLPFHQWIDNFHTGFNLECIHKYQRYTGDHTFDEVIKKGTEFYLGHFFMPDGASKYYHDKLYPVDIHSPAQLIITLDELGLLQQQAPLVEKVLHWTIQHMQNSKGHFYYQLKKGFSSRIPYMRWAQAWMFYAMSYYLNKRIDGQATD